MPERLGGNVDVFIVGGCYIVIELGMLALAFVPRSCWVNNCSGPCWVNNCSGFDVWYVLIWLDCCDADALSTCMGSEGGRFAVLRSGGSEGGSPLMRLLSLHGGGGSAIGRR